MRTSNNKYRVFEEEIRAMGCPVTGATNDLNIHHLEGRSFKHNKQLIGPFLIIPLYQPGGKKNLHQQGENSVHDYTHSSFESTYGCINTLTLKLLKIYLLENGGGPWNREQWRAIVEYLS